MADLSTDAPALFKGRHFDATVIIVCVGWYLTYTLSRAAQPASGGVLCPQLV